MPGVADTDVYMQGSLLQLRGSVSNASPLVDCDGNALAFNGEVFEGLGEIVSLAKRCPSALIHAG